MSAREKAEMKAVELARECEASGRPGRRCVEGSTYAAIGGWDADGIWHFAAEIATPEDKADVREWMKS